RDMWAWLGITSDAVQRGHNASFYSGEMKFTDDERARFGEWLDRIYKDFVTKAADGRGKTFDEVHAIAQGRVWWGGDAVKRGLVDEMGGLETAVRRAAELAHVPAGSPVDLVEMPAPKSFLQELWSRDDDASSTVTALRRTIRGVLEEGKL